MLVRVLAALLALFVSAALRTPSALCRPKTSLAALSLRPLSPSTLDIGASSKGGCTCASHFCYSLANLRSTRASSAFLLAVSETDSNDGGNNGDNEDNNNNREKLKKFMVDSIKWYRSALSPIMPPNCRFLPSCSNYGIQAIETFGPWRGGLLTAWRIMRCNPFGGSGYDPPRWPPF